MMVANNSSTNVKGNNGANGTCLLPIDFVAVMISYATIYSVLMIVSLVGNSLLIYACFRSNIKMGNIIANIAASDLLFSIVLFPREIVAQIKQSAAFAVHGWVGQILCKISAFVTDVTIAVSTLSLVLITVDRLAAVVFPGKYRRITVKKRRFLILSTWILAMAIHSPYFYTFRLDTRNGETFCITNWEPAFNHKSTYTRYSTALLVTVLIVPLVTVSILQTVILSKLRSDKLAPFRSSISNLQHTKRNKNLLNMSIAISSIFALCWLPFLVLNFFYLYSLSSIPRCGLGFEISRQFVVFLSLCHCIANPFICFTFMRRVRCILKPGILKPVAAPRKSSTCMETRL